MRTAIAQSIKNMRSPGSKRKRKSTGLVQTRREELPFSEVMIGSGGLQVNTFSGRMVISFAGCAQTKALSSLQPVLTISPPIREIWNYFGTKTIGSHLVSAATM
jgi:hypothetical protein